MKSQVVKLEAQNSQRGPRENQKEAETNHKNDHSNSSLKLNETIISALNKSKGQFNPILNTHSSNDTLDIIDSELERNKYIDNLRNPEKQILNKI